MIKNKRGITIIILAAIVLLALVGTTIAYFSLQTETVNNIFTIGSIDVDVVEEFPTPTGPDAVKKVQIQNTGKSDEYVRVMLVPTFRTGTSITTVSHAGNVDFSKVNTNGIIVVTSPDEVVTYTMYLASAWSNNWYFSTQDNMFYYRKVLKGDSTGNRNGDLTELLLERVVSSGSDWKGLEIEVLADAVQTQGDAVAEHLKNNWGVTSIEDDGTLKW